MHTIFGELVVKHLPAHSCLYYPKKLLLTIDLCLKEVYSSHFSLISFQHMLTTHHLKFFLPWLLKNSSPG